MAGKRPMKVLGLCADHLTGGVHAAEMVTDGHAIQALGPAHFEPFGASVTGEDADAIAHLVEDTAARAMDRFEPPELVGFRGLFRRDDMLGNGAILAEASGCPVAWDFFGNDLKMGGVGRTLPGLFAHPLLTAAGLRGRQALIELGPVARLAVVDLDNPLPEQAVSVTEPGPGIGLLRGPAGRTRAEVADDVVEAILGRPFFARMGPRVLPPALMQDILAATDRLPSVQIRPTRTALIALSVAAALEMQEHLPETLILSGAGPADADLLAVIRAVSPVPVRSLSELSIADEPLSPQTTEAKATAWLAARVVAGLPTSGPNITGAPGFVGGAEVSRPQT